MTPNIGVSCNVEEVLYGGLWTELAAMVPMTYVRAIARAGGRPLLIAPTPADLAEPGPLLKLLDGVLITGGADLAAQTYGAAAHPETAPSDADRDAFELALVRAASARDLPCLGICRGIQVVNVALAARSSSTCPTGSSTTSTAAPAATSPTTTSTSSPRASRRSPPATPGSPCAATTTRASSRSATGCA